MEEEKKGVSFLVFVGFLVLFVLFLFVEPSSKGSGNVVIGSITLGESPSIITLIILFVILIIILAAVFIILKKLKKKKIKVETPMEDKKPGFEVKKENKKSSNAELDDGDIEKLFSGNGETIREEKPKEELKEKKSEEKVQQPEKKVLTNLQDLKNKIKGMLSQNATREQIIGNLKLQGITMDQIGKAMEDVN